MKHIYRRVGLNWFRSYSHHVEYTDILKLVAQGSLRLSKYNIHSKAVFKRYCKEGSKGDLKYGGLISMLVSFLL